MAARFVDEGLRTDEHPGVAFREGPIGRRAALLGGPDVWEIVRAVQASRTVEPDVSENDLLELVAANGGVPVRQVRTAVAYWAAYPVEIEALLEHAARFESEALAAHERTVGLLAQ